MQQQQRVQTTNETSECNQRMQQQQRANNSDARILALKFLALLRDADEQQTCHR